MNDLKQFEQQNLQTFKDIALVVIEKKKLEEKEKLLKECLLKLMDENNVKSVDNDFIKITKIASSESVSVDLKSFEKTEPLEFLALKTDYPKLTLRKGYLKFEVK